MKQWKILLMTSVFFLITISSALCEKMWWEKWDAYPDVPRIMPKQVKALLLAGEKIIFIYAGYKVDEILCGSLKIPYTLVPPNGDGSRVRLKIPKDWWIMCY